MLNFFCLPDLLDDAYASGYQQVSKKYCIQSSPVHFRHIRQLKHMAVSGRGVDVALGLLANL
jgi:hypothetical protein